MHNFMYICMSIYMYICITNSQQTYKHTNTNPHVPTVHCNYRYFEVVNKLFICKYIYIYIYVYIYVCMFVCMYVYICMYKYMHNKPTTNIQVYKPTTNIQTHTMHCNCRYFKVINQLFICMYVCIYA